MAMPIKSVLNSLLNQHNDWRLKVVKNWQTIMGPLHTKVSVEKIENKTLYLASYDSCWLTELHMLSRFIIKNVNAALEGGAIKNVRFSLKTRPEIRSYACVPPEVEQPYQPYTLSSQEKAALSSIKDDNLQLVLEQFLKRCKHAR